MKDLEAGKRRFELVIFDVDGTLVETYGLRLLPNVESFFQLVLNGNCPHPPELAIATNQGGVGMRCWMERGGFGKPEKYPTEMEVSERLQTLVSLLGGGQKLRVYVSFGYRTRAGKWAPAPTGSEGDPRWSPEWRKPKPGMLLQAMADAGARPEQTLFIGDREDDRNAAAAAGCAFAWAGDFFARPWEDCSRLSGFV